MIRSLVDFALNNRFMVLAAAMLLFIWGGVSFYQLPVEAYPDVANNYVEVITQWPGIAAEQIEQQVTVPLEIAMNGIPQMVHLRTFFSTMPETTSLSARYQINVADVQDAIQTAVGGNALTQVLKGEERYDLVLRYQQPYRDSREAIANIRLLAPAGERVSLAQLCNVRVSDGASEIYREGNSRYIAVKFSIRGRDLGGAVEEAIRKVDSQVKLPRGYLVKWEGEYESAKRAQARLALIVPLTILLISIILYTMFGSFKWSLLVLCNVMMAPVGGMLVLWFTGTNFSVSSGVGFLALFGVSVQTGVIMLEYINQLRARGHSIEDSAVEGAVLRLRPIMMTMLVATLGLLPAALSHGIGSDSQRPFAMVIVGGLLSGLAISIFLMPTLYVWVAGNNDVLPAPEAGFSEEL